MEVNKPQFTICTQIFFFLNISCSIIITLVTNSWCAYSVSELRLWHLDFHNTFPFMILITSYISYNFPLTHYNFFTSSFTVCIPPCIQSILTPFQTLLYTVMCLIICQSATPLSHSQSFWNCLDSCIAVFNVFQLILYAL